MYIGKYTSTMEHLGSFQTKIDSFRLSWFRRRKSPIMQVSNGGFHGHIIYECRKNPLETMANQVTHPTLFCWRITKKTVVAFFVYPR